MTILARAVFPQREASRQFFDVLLDGAPPGTLVLRTAPDRYHYPIASCRPDQAAAYSELLASDNNVYFGLGLRKEGFRARELLGKEPQVTAWPGFGCDVDVAHAVHTATNLPPTVEAALQPILDLGLEPTLVVHTGYGIQLYWLLATWMVLRTPEDRAAAKDLSVGLQQAIRRAFGSPGWNLDRTADLAHVFRPPGTLNHKVAGQPVPVTILEMGGRRWSPDELASIASPTTPATRKPTGRTVSRSAARNESVVPGRPAADRARADLGVVLSGCPWMAHCRDDAVTLTEPEWHAMISITTRCVEGVRLTHDLSRPYPRYSSGETDDYISRALAKAGPRTCNSIAELTANRYCNSCPHRRRVTTPVVLGLPTGSGEWRLSLTYADGAADIAGTVEEWMTATLMLPWSKREAISIRVLIWLLGHLALVGGSTTIAVAQGWVGMWLGRRPEQIRELLERLQALGAIDPVRPGGLAGPSIYELNTPTITHSESGSHPPPPAAATAMVSRIRDVSGAMSPLVGTRVGWVKLAFETANRDATVAQLLELLQVSRHALNPWLNRLADSGVVKKVGHGRWVLLDLTDEEIAVQTGLLDEREARAADHRRRKERRHLPQADPDHPVYELRESPSPTARYPITMWKARNDRLDVLVRTGIAHRETDGSIVDIETGSVWLGPRPT